MKTETTIVLADDHPIFRQGLRQLIEREAGWRVVAEAEDGQSALAQIEAEGHERIWPPLPPRKQSLAPILDAGLQLCPRPSPQRR